MFSRFFLTRAHTYLNAFARKARNLHQENLNKVDFDATQRFGDQGPEKHPTHRATIYRELHTITDPSVTVPVQYVLQMWVHYHLQRDIVSLTLFWQGNERARFQLSLHFKPDTTVYDEYIEIIDTAGQIVGPGDTNKLLLVEVFRTAAPNELMNQLKSSTGVSFLSNSNGLKAGCFSESKQKP